MLKNLKLVTSTKNLEELSALQDELAWEEEFTLPRWAYSNLEFIRLVSKKRRLQILIAKLKGNRDEY